MPVQNQIFPKSFTENTAEFYLSKVSVKSQLIYTTILVSIVCIFISLPLIYIDVSVKGAGVLRTVLEKNELKTLLGGTIISIQVKDNQQIKEGEVLFKLNTENLDTKLKLNYTQQAEKQQFLQDLEILLGHKDFKTRIQLSSAFYTQQFNQLYFALLEKQSQIQKASQDLDRAKLLHSQQVIATAELEEKQFVSDKLNAEYQNLIETQRSQWSSELNTLKISLTEMQSQLTQLEQEKSLYQIKSPTDGTFQLSQGKYVGSYVQAGEILGIISPDSNLIAECYLSPKDIGLLKENMQVTFQVDAFNYNDWGTVKGEVIEIANDYVLLDNKPVFKVKCGLIDKEIKLNNGYSGVLKKGMTIQARFVVAKRSLFQLLYDNIDDWVNPM